MFYLIIFVLTYMCLILYRYNKSETQAQAHSGRGEEHIRRGDEEPAEQHVGHRDHAGPGAAHAPPHALEGDRRRREAVHAARQAHTLAGAVQGACVSIISGYFTRNIVVI